MRIVSDQAIVNALKKDKGVSTPDLLKGVKPAAKPRAKKSATGSVFGSKVSGGQGVNLKTLKGAMEVFDSTNPYTNSTPDKLTNPDNIKRQKAKSYLYARANGQEGNFGRYLDEFETLWRMNTGKIDEVIARYKDRRMNDAAKDRDPSVISRASVLSAEERYEKEKLLKKFGTETPQLSDVITALGQDISPTNAIKNLATSAAKGMYDLPEDWEPDAENDSLFKAGLMAGNLVEYLTPGLNAFKIAGDASMLTAKTAEEKSLAPVGEYVKENLRALNPFESGIDPVERGFRVLSLGLTTLAVKPHLSGLKAKGLGNKSRAVLGIAWEMVSPAPTPNILLPRAQALSAALRTPAGKDIIKVAKEIEKRYVNDDGYAEVRQAYSDKFRENNVANIPEADIDAAVTLLTAQEMQLRELIKNRSGEDVDMVGALDVRGIDRTKVQEPVPEMLDTGVSGKNAKKGVEAKADRAAEQERNASMGPDGLIRTTPGSGVPSRPRRSSPRLAKKEMPAKATEPVGKMVEDAPVAKPAKDTAPAKAKEPWEMTRKEFERSGYLLHKDIRSKTQAERDAATKSISESGMERRNMSLGNTLPAYRGGEPMDVVEKSYAPRSGDRGYLIPKSGVDKNRNYIHGHKPTEGEIIDFSKDYQSAHEAAVETALRRGKPVPAEVLADYPDLAKKYGTAKDAPAAPAVAKTAKPPKPAKPAAKPETGKLPIVTVPGKAAPMPAKRFSVDGFELENPVKAENGYTLTSYNWKNKIELVWSEGKQELVEKRVSNWDESEENSHTARKIVHQFFVTSPTGEGRWVSLESAAKLMGVIPESIKGVGSSVRTLLKNKALSEALAIQIATVEESFKKWNAAPKPEPVIEADTWVGGSRDGWMVARVGDGDSSFKPGSFGFTKGDAIESATKKWVENRVAEETKVKYPDITLLEMKYQLERVNKRIDKASQVIKKPKATNDSVELNQAVPALKNEMGIEPGPKQTKAQIEKAKQKAAALAIQKLDKEPPINLKTASDAEIKGRLVERGYNDIKEWRASQEALTDAEKYESFYVSNSRRAGKLVADYVRDNYGNRELTEAEVELFHYLSAMGSPSNSPVNDSSIGLRLLIRVFEHDQLSPYVKDAEKWTKQVGGGKAGVKVTDVRPNEAGVETVRPGKDSPAYDDDAVLNLIKLRDEKFGGDLAATLKWMQDKHPWEEVNGVARDILKKKIGEKEVKGVKVPIYGMAKHEYTDGQTMVNGVFALNPAKLGSYWLNRLGHLDTVTKDMWWARTMMRHLGQSLFKGGVPIKEPWKAETAEGLRLRRLADEAWREISARLEAEGYKETDMAHIQEQMWDYEQKLWIKHGMVPSSGNITQGVEAGIRAIAEGKGYKKYEAGRPANSKELRTSKIWDTFETLRDEIYGPQASGKGRGAKPHKGNELRGYTRDARQSGARSVDGRPLAYTNPAGVKVAPKVIATYTPNKSVVKAISTLGGRPVRFHEIGPSGHKDYIDLVQSVLDSGDFGKQVSVPKRKDLIGARVFISDDGLSGFALIGENITGLISRRPGGMMSHQMLQLATDLGGRKLDAFDTYLVKIYAQMGFQATHRIPFSTDPSIMPKGWNANGEMSHWNGGKPDLVFMKWNPGSVKAYQSGDGKMAKDYLDAAAKRDASILSTRADWESAGKEAKTGILYQAFAPKQTNKGTYVWDPKQKRGLITLFENADISTILHETAHHQLRYMPKDMYRVIAQGAGVDPNTDMDKLKRADYVRVQEFYARGVEDSLYQDAVNPNPKIQAAFNHAAKRIRTIYGEAGVPLPEGSRGRTLNQDPGKGGEKPDYSAVSEVFAQMLGGTVKPLREAPMDSMPVKTGAKVPVEAPEGTQGKDFGISNAAFEESSNILAPVGKGRSAKRLVEAAKAKITDDQSALALARSIRDGETPKTAESLAELQVGVGLLENRVNKARDRVLKSPDDPGVKGDYETARTDLQEYADSIQRAKSEWSDEGRVLAARVDEMGNFARMQASATIAKGSPLTPKEVKELEAMSDKFQQAKKELETANNELQKLRAESAVATAATRKRTIGTVKAIREDAKTARELLSSRVLNQLSEETSTEDLVWAIAKEHILDGDKNLQSIAKKIGAEFEMSPDEVIQYIGAPATPRTKSEVAIAIAKLRTEARELTGNLRTAKRKASKTAKASGAKVKPDLLNDKAAIKKRVSSLEAITKKYADKRAAKDYSKAAKPQVPKAKAVLEAEAKLVAEKNKFLAERRKLVMAAKRAATASKVRTRVSGPRKPRAKVDLVGDAVAIKKRIAELDAKIKATQAKIDAQDYSVPPRAEVPKTQAIKDAEAKLKDTQKDFRKAKNQVALRDDPVAIEKRLAAINKKLLEYQVKLKTKDYSMPIKEERAKAQSIIEAEGTLWMERRKFESMRRHLSNPEPLAKTVIKEAAGVLRWSQLGADLGALLRQGRYVLRHPKAYAHGLKNMLAAMKNDETYAAVMAGIENRNMADGKPAMPIRVKAGLSLTDQFTHLEEAFTSRMLKKIPVLRKYSGSLERAQVGFLNTVRADIFDSFYNSASDLSVKELQSRARLVNSLTGRSNIKNVPEAFSVIMTSPRYYASRWELLYAAPENMYKALIKGDRGAKENMKDIAVGVASLAVPLLVAHVVLSARDEKDGVVLDPMSSDFLKVRVGGNVYDISAGMAPKLRVLLRAVMAFTQKDEEGKSDTGFFGDTLLQEVFNAVSPGIRTPAEMYAGRSLTGFDIDDPREQGFRKLLPLIVQQTWKNIEDGSSPGIIAAHFLGEFIGLSQIGKYKYKAPADVRRPGTHQNIMVPRAKGGASPKRKTTTKPMTRQERVDAFMRTGR